MHFPTPLIDATLLRRYRRFLADVQFPDNTTTTVHCANTGSMLSCSAPGSPVCLSRAENPARRYPLTLEMVRVGAIWVGVNTSRTNALVQEALLAGKIAQFPQVDRVKREVRTAPHTRLDLQVEWGGLTTFIEVKNCSLAIAGQAMFPDAVTVRGAKHLAELTRLAESGLSAALFFLVQRMDAESFSPADHIDPGYGQALRRASATGVTILVYQAEVTPQGIEVVRPLPCDL
jgi:sugar fermentation stimulation protein A